MGSSDIQIVGLDEAMSSIKTQAREYAEDLVDTQAAEICNWINYELSVTAMEYQWTNERADEDMVQIYDPDHAQLRVSHMAMYIADIFYAVVEPGEEDLSRQVVVKTRDDREITDEMQVSLEMTLDNTMRIVG